MSAQIGVKDQGHSTSRSSKMTHAYPAYVCTWG